MKPHGKVQVVFSGKDVKMVTLLFEHDGKTAQQEMKEKCLAQIVEPIVGTIAGIQILVNPYTPYGSGEFQKGSGSTGRKVANDTYGGLIPHGISAISGKDPYSPDRAGAYMARLAAKSIVYSGLATNAMVSVGYTLGKSEPIMIQARAGDGTDLTELVKKNFDFRPEEIVKRLGLNKPIYRDTACYGHFGRFGMPWEESVKIQNTKS